MGIDKYSYHELVDRSHVVTSYFEDHIVNHAVVDSNQNIKNLALSISYDLGRLYQEAAIAADSFEIKTSGPIVNVDIYKIISDAKHPHILLSPCPKRHNTDGETMIGSASCEVCSRNVKTDSDLGIVVCRVRE